jgi:hypothetical protein
MSLWPQTVGLHRHKDAGELHASYSLLTCWGAPQIPIPMEDNEATATGTKANKELVKRFRVTQDEAEKIAAKAAKAGLTWSEYCRRAALDKTINEKVPASFRLQLVGAANNLNQLTRLAHAGKLSGISADSLKELVERLLQTLK